MPVHPDFQAILNVLNTLPPADYTRDPLAIARELRLNPVNIPPLPNPVAVEVRKVIGPDGHAIPVRIYRPATPAPHAVMISIHGGGWVRGSLDADEYRCHFMAHHAGCAVVSVDYRMAPEHRYPTALDDCLAVTRWVRAEAAALGFDPARVGIAGDSAGANLATAVAMKLRNAGEPGLACQVLIYPVCDHDFDTASYRENGEGKLLSRDFMMWCWDQYAAGADRDDPCLSPLRSPDLSAMPPALVLTAEFDPLRDEGAGYAEALRQAGNAVEYDCLPGAIHAFQSIRPAHPMSTDSFVRASRFAAQHLAAGG